MINEGHIFTVKTKDPSNVAAVTQGGAGIVITGLNVLRDQVEAGDFIFVVFGGDNPRDWKPGLVALAHVSKPPYVGAGDTGRNFRIEIDVDLYFQPSVKRADLVSYPDTFDTIGIGPITKWEPNQALTAVAKKNAVGLLQALCDLFPEDIDKIKAILGSDFGLLEKPVRRYIEATSLLGEPKCAKALETAVDLRQQFKDWMVDVAGKAPKTAKDTANVYVSSISDELKDPTIHIWHGLREALYGEPAPKKVYELDDVAELEQYYSGIAQVFGKKYDATGFAEANYKKCWDWAHGPANHNSISAGWSLFTRFMKWREEQKPIDIGKIDILTIALRQFQKGREDAEKYQGEEDAAREWFADFTEEKLKSNFEFFLKKMIWANMVRIQIGKDYEHVDEFAKLLGELKTNPGTVEYYTSKEYSERLEKCPGVGLSTVFDMLMKMHPEAYGCYNSRMRDSLVFLGLLPPGSSDKVTPESYRRVMGQYEFIRQRMIKMQIGMFNEGKFIEPDFLTINAFLWYVDENKDLVKEKVMKNEFKPAESKPKTGDCELKDAVANDEMMQRLMAALRTKPFAILAGHSGTGKSQLVRRLAYMTCNDEVLLEEAKNHNAPGNYCMVQVKPNWHDSTDLLGYYTEMGGGHYHTTAFVEFICKAYAYPNTPFFVCLDEMNLAPVEQYFAEYLSAVESARIDNGMFITDSLITERANVDEICGSTKLNESKAWFEKHGLTIPKNLFVVGTVNVDETTCQFSRKVLDRAMTLLMTAVSFDSMTKENDPSAAPHLKPNGITFFLERSTQAKLVQGQMDWLKKVQEQVGDTAFAIAYRFANECALYQAAYQKLMGGSDDPNDAGAQKTAIDHTVLMKLLPRIHGTEDEVTALFKGRESEPKKDGLIKALGEGQSVNMMNDILKRGGDYISFWP